MTDEIKRLRAERDAWRELAQAASELLECYEAYDANRADVAMDRVVIAQAALRALGVEP
jgi:hypothetical protein